jgi:cytidine deaminase
VRVRFNAFPFDFSKTFISFVFWNNKVETMKQLTLKTEVSVYEYEELNEADRALAEAARQATHGSYAPYSHFHVGAAALLADGTVVTGANQENAAYPSGLCAERTTIFYAGARYPHLAVKALAIAANDEQGGPVSPIPPCGACRQVLLETEQRFGVSIRILLCGRHEVYVVESASELLPLTFGSEFLK